MIDLSVNSLIYINFLKHIIFGFKLFGKNKKVAFAVYVQFDCF